MSDEDEVELECPKCGVTPFKQGALDTQGYVGYRLNGEEFSLKTRGCASCGYVEFMIDLKSWRSNAMLSIFNEFQDQVGWMAEEVSLETIASKRGHNVSNLVPLIDELDDFWLTENLEEQLSTERLKVESITRVGKGEDIVFRFEYSGPDYIDFDTVREDMKAKGITVDFLTCTQCGHKIILPKKGQKVECEGCSRIHEAKTIRNNLKRYLKL